MSFASKIFELNLDAIRVLKDIESKDRLATDEEKSILSCYQGFRGCTQAFFKTIEPKTTTNGWEQQAKQLYDLLSEQEYKLARDSAANAFFTPNYIVKDMYKALVFMGVEGKHLSIFEPGMGTGNFL